MSELTVYNPEMFIFLDETGSDKRDAHRRYAYSWRGKPARIHKLLVRGQHMNAIAFMSVDGLLDCHIEEGSVDGDVFSLQFRGYLSHTCHLTGQIPIV